MRIEFTSGYTRMYVLLVADDETMKTRVVERVKWFRKNQSDTRLDNHPLHKKMKGKWAFSITDDLRIVYEKIGKTTVRFLAIGTHKIIYPPSS